MQGAVGARTRFPASPIAAVLVVLGLPACVGPQRSYGPLPVRNQHPAQLTVLHLDPVSATPLRSGAVAARATVGYTSLFLAGNGNGNALVLDGEVLRSSVQVRVGLGNELELGAELPVLHTSGGFLDSFLIGYHDLLGLPSQDRDLAPKNQFGVAADFQGHRVFEMRSEPLLLADVPLSLTYGLLSPQQGRPGLALRLGIELPTGHADRGAGNGETDVAIGLVTTWPLRWATLHGAVQHTVAGSPSRARDAGFAFADVTSASCALELPLLADLSAVGQVEWETSTLRPLDFQRAAKDQVLLWLGGRLRVDRDLFVEVSFGEDLAGFVSPDFTAWIGLAWLPGAALGRGAE